MDSPFADSFVWYIIPRSNYFQAERSQKGVGAPGPGKYPQEIQKYFGFKIIFTNLTIMKTEILVNYTTMRPYSALHQYHESMTVNYRNMRLT